MSYQCSRCGRGISVSSSMNSCPHCGAYLNSESVKAAAKEEGMSAGCGSGVVLFFSCFLGSIALKRDDGDVAIGIVVGVLAAIVSGLIGRYVLTR